MVLNFTVEYLNICNEWHHICHGHHKGEKAHGSKRQKPDVHIGFWRLCTASVHVNTAFIFLSTLNLPPCLSKIFKYMMFKFLKKCNCESKIIIIKKKESKHFYSGPTSKLSPRFLSSPPERKKLLSPCQAAFFENLSPLGLF